MFTRRFEIQWGQNFKESKRSQYGNYELREVSDRFLKKFSYKQKQQKPSKFFYKFLALSDHPDLAGMLILSNFSNVNGNLPPLIK